MAGTGTRYEKLWSSHEDKQISAETLARFRRQAFNGCDQ